MNTRAFEIEYVYDPLCGCCYASGPALGAIANAHPKALRTRPSGLFAGSGARPESSNHQDEDSCAFVSGRAGLSPCAS